MNIVDIGDKVSCTHNSKTIIGELTSYTADSAAVYITDETGSYSVNVPLASLQMPFTGDRAFVYGQLFFEREEAPFNQELIDFINGPKIEPIIIPKEEEISKPQRYNKVGTLECWDVILDQKMDFLEGSVIKYLWRHKEKNGKHDLKKAKEYLEKMIADYDKLYGGK